MCIFCKIISGEIPSKKIYEDENVLAILDISQATKGHTLVMPKKHFENIFEIDAKDYLNVMQVVHKICKHYKDTNKSILGINVLNNNGQKAGQSVNHLHYHILPRYEEDDLEINFQEHQYDLEEIQKEFKL